MTTARAILSEFQRICHQHYTCFVLATGGVNNFVRDIANGPPATVVFLSAQDPTKATPTARITMGELRALGTPDGQFSDVLAKAILVSLYSEWDEYFRPRLAESIGVPKNAVRSNIIGDLRLIRNCIVHSQSVVANEHQRIVALSWPTIPGPLKITLQMMTELFNKLNSLEVNVVQTEA
jgi:hypothetical protein